MAFRHIVRIANTDLKGERSILMSLRQIKGIGHNFSHMILVTTGIEELKKTGDLSDAEIEKITSVLKDPAKFGIPSWAFNRRHDIETGLDRHLIITDLTFARENDVRRLRKIKSYRGIRHGAGLPLRGQRTKSNFRKNKGRGSLGVKRKKEVK